MDKKFAELLGLLCAEGSHIISYSNYLEKGKRIRKRVNKKSERIEFYNKDPKLLFHYQRLVEDIFGVKQNITKHNKINLGKRLLIKKIIAETALGHISWRVPNSILTSDKEIKLSFIRGYFDGDGTASGPVRFFSSNPIGLRQVSLLLKDLDFQHTFLGPYKKSGRKNHYVIQIARKQKQKFLSLVQPISKLPL